MLSDWIKMRTDLYRDPKVSIMADCLMADRSALARYVNQNMQCDMSVTRNVMRNAVCGALISVWGVMRHQGKRDGADLVVDGIDELTIDDVAELQGFGEAMMVAGWLDATPVDPDTTRLRFPKFFAENNVDPQEESRKKNAERQRRYRESKSDSNVTGNVTGNADVTSREEREKRREENNIKRTPTPLDKPQPDQTALPGAAALPPDSGKAKRSRPRKPVDPIMIPDALASHPGFLEQWAAWEAYRRESKKTLTASTRNSQLLLLSRHGPAKAMEMMSRSITNGWTGLFPSDDAGGHRGARRASNESTEYRGAKPLPEDQQEKPF
jgi:hypothetical protein